MIPTVKAEGKATSLECWQDESALIYDSIDQLDERVRKPLTAGAKNSPQPEAA